MLFKEIYNYGDKFEDKIRRRLSHYPIIYAFIGGAGVVIFWRGVWHSVDYLMSLFEVVDNVTSASTNQLIWWDGPLSIAFGSVLLLISGLFVTSFIGNEIIVSGLKQEKRIAEKTEEEIKSELSEDIKIEQKIQEINDRMKKIEEILSK